MKLLDAENPFNFSTELRNIIPVTLLAKSTETVEVLPDLRGGKAHFFREFFGGNPGFSPAA